jgi:hypothetical protein
VILGIGAAVELESATPRAGAASFVEYEALPGHLEIELGGQMIILSAAREYSLDLLIKWPRHLGSQLEIMVGAGPAIVRGGTQTQWGVEGAVDLMWWPTLKLGLWIEPSYELVFHGTAAGTVGCTTGPMLGW